MNGSKYKISLGWGIGIILSIILVYLVVFGRALSQKENHLGIALALPRVLLGSKTMPIDGETYLAKDLESFLKEMERQGFVFVDQFGAGLIFEKDGKRYFSSTRMYSSHFMIFTYPQVSEVPKNDLKLEPEG